MVIDYLAKYGEYSDGEIKWLIKNPFKPPKYDFGLAHGMAGYPYFFGKCYQNDIEPELCKRLGDGIVAFYNNNTQEYEEVGSF